MIDATIKVIVVKKFNPAEVVNLSKASSLLMILNLFTKPSSQSFSNLQVFPSLFLMMLKIEDTNPMKKRKEMQYFIKKKYNDTPDPKNPSVLISAVISIFSFSYQLWLIINDVNKCNKLEIKDFQLFTITQPQHGHISSGLIAFIFLTIPIDFAF